MNTAKKIVVSLDGGTKYNAFTFGERWNGFECPMFRKSVAMQIKRDINKTDSFESTAFYYKSENAFYFEGEKITAQTIEFNGKIIEVFAIGYNAWCWQEVNDTIEQVETYLREKYPEYVSYDIDGDIVNVMIDRNKPEIKLLLSNIL